MRLLRKELQPQRLFRELQLQQLPLNLIQQFAASKGGTNQPTIDDAYAILGTDKNVTDKELKRVYRRLLAQHHPDKLVAKGLPEEMKKMAKEKTQEIINAYEQIKKQRDMR